MSLTVEQRLDKLEESQVYLPENLKDIEQRLIRLEDALKEIPSDLVEHWSEMIAKVKKIHQEDK